VCECVCTSVCVAYVCCVCCVYVCVYVCVLFVVCMHAVGGEETRHPFVIQPCWCVHYVQHPFLTFFASVAGAAVHSANTATCPL
jgi:hypothetical protein